MDGTEKSTDWLAGYEEARVQAAAIARLYENELSAMRLDKVLLMDYNNIGEYGIDRNGNISISISHGQVRAADMIASAIEGMVPTIKT